MSTTTIRRPVVAGRFYPRDSAELREQVLRQIGDASQASRAIGCMVPHAGYIYSGYVAGAVFAHVNVPPVCIVLCPNHTGMGEPLAILSEGAWQTPLGEVAIHTETAERLKQKLPILKEDAAAHQGEHAIEVELPFLQVRRAQLQFVPIAIGTGRWDALEQLGQATADVIAGEKQDVLIVASSDMNHYESDAVTRIKDQRAIERLLTLDARGLYEVVTQQNVSMCGFGPAVAMLTAARQLGATSAELVKYATSGDISGDRQMVVGYAGVVIR